MNKTAPAMHRHGTDGTEGHYVQDHLWIAMKAAYGALWTNSYGDHDETGMWAGALSKFDAVTIAAAVKQAVVFHRQYPPTLGQFTALCLDARSKVTPPQITHDPIRSGKNNQREWVQDLAALIGRKKKHDAEPMTKQELEYHERAIGIDDDTLKRKAARRSAPGAEGSCCYPGCTSPGTMSNSTTGAESWCCSTHYR